MITKKKPVGDSTRTARAHAHLERLNEAKGKPGLRLNLENSHLASACLARINRHSLILEALATLVTGYTTLWLCARRWRELSARIDAADPGLWSVAVNGVRTGEISDADYARSFKGVKQRLCMASPKGSWARGSCLQWPATHTTGTRLNATFLMRNDMEIKLSKPQRWLLLVVIMDFTVCITSMLADVVNGAQAHDPISRYALAGLLHGGLSMQILLIWIFFTNLSGGGRGRGRRSSSVMTRLTSTPKKPRSATVGGKCQFIN